MSNGSGIKGGQGRSDEQAEEHADACLLVCTVIIVGLVGALMGGWAVYLWLLN